MDLLLTVDGKTVEGLDGHAECSLSDFTNQATWDDRATEPISTTILEEKKWVLRLYLIPSDDEGDEYKDEYRQKQHTSGHT